MPDGFEGDDGSEGGENVGLDGVDFDGVENVGFDGVDLEGDENVGFELPDDLLDDPLE